MTSVVSAFPNAIATWTDRVDQENIVFANDPNSLAAEVISIEKTLGVNPQIEKAPIIGNPVTYASVDARMSAIQQAQQLPVMALRNQNIFVSNALAFPGLLLSYQRLFDPYNMYNGVDVTLPVSGWYFITAHVKWDWWGNGWNHHGLYVNGTGGLLDEFYVRWDLEGNTPGGPIYGQPQNAKVYWQGPLAANTRVSVYMHNGTSDARHKILLTTFHVSCITKLQTIDVVTAF